MAQNIEDHLPVVKYEGLNTAKNTVLGGTLAVTGAATFTGAITTTAAQVPTGGVGAAGGFTASPRCLWTGGNAANALTTGTDTAFTTTQTQIAEVYIPSNVTVTGVAVLMGSAAGNGNLNVALANSSGVVVASSATTTTSGTSTTFTKVAFSSTYAAVGPATYYVLVQGSNASDKYRGIAAGTFGASAKTSETYGTFTTVSAPTTFTAAAGVHAQLY